MPWHPTSWITYREQTHKLPHPLWVYWWWSLHMAWLSSCGCKQRHSSPDSFQAYATDKTVSIGSSTEVITHQDLQSCPILHYAIGCMEIGQFWGYDWQVGHCHIAWWCIHQGTDLCLGTYLGLFWLGPLSTWLELFSWVLVVLEWGQAGGMCLRWLWHHISCWQLPISHIEPQDNRTRGVYHIPTGVYLVGLCTGGTRVPGDRPMKWSKEGYLGTIVGCEPSVASIKVSWVTYLVNGIRIEVFEEMQW